MNNVVLSLVWSLSISLVVLFGLSDSLTAQARVTAKLRYEEIDYFGWPLAFDGKRIALLSADGKLLSIPSSSQANLRLVSKEFLPQTAEQMRAALVSEFGDRYEVTVGQKYVVVHPWGDPQIWAAPFEHFHDRFVEFVKQNGVELKQPEFPMVAVVLRSRVDFDRLMNNEVEIRDRRVAGYYSRITNRISTYNPGGKLRVGPDRWMYQSTPVIHEATHQSAFNTGLHNRFAPPPLWLSEGLAMLFEAPGFNHASRFTRFEDRLNRTRLQQLRKYLMPDMQEDLVQLISDDQLFVEHPEKAYSLSWGLSFYLFENQPTKYFEYLAADAARPNFMPYSRSDRRKDFVKFFGNDIESLSAGLDDLLR
jgi:hypothetical protein